MNRRDTILISVLVNMALLIALFVFAIKPATPIEIAKVSLQGEKKTLKLVETSEKVTLDQVDNLLSKFVAQEVKSEVVQIVSEIIENSEPLIQSNNREIIVKQGDSLEKIAKNFHTTVSDIMKLNRLIDSRLHIGQILYIPLVSESARELKPLPPTIPTSNNKAEAKYYIVKHGDNPWTIAIKNGIKVDELLKLNSLDESKAKKLKPGDKLRIQ